MRAEILAALGLLVLVLLYVRDAQRQRRQRAMLFARCLELFESCRVTQHGNGYPVLDGTYAGLCVRLEPVLDCIAARKLPSLWLKVTLLAPNSVTGVLDYLVRPQGVEFYSPAAEMPFRVGVPRSWPQEAILCTDDLGRMPQLASLEAHRALFEDPRFKELLITPRGTRLVNQLWQAERAEYLVLRQAKFASTYADPSVVREMLEAVVAISRSVSDPPNMAEAA